MIEGTSTFEFPLIADPRMKKCKSLLNKLPLQVASFSAHPDLWALEQVPDTLCCRWWKYRYLAMVD
jgi:hypothetical protein